MQRVQIAAMVLSGSPARSAKSPLGSADPLGPIAGRSLTAWVIDAALGASIRRIVVLSADHLPVVTDEITSRLDRALITCVTPTLHSDSIDAVARAVDLLVHDFSQRESTHVLLLAAEAPQVEAAELRALIADHVESGAAASVLGAVRSGVEEISVEPVVTYDVDGTVGSIVEPLVSGGSSVFGAICVQAALLIPALRRVTPHGWRHGPLVHDALHALEEAGHTVDVIPRTVPLTPIESAASRAPIEAELRSRIVNTWLERGVVVEDPSQVVIDSTVVLGHDVRIRPGTVLEGNTVVGDGAVIGPNSHLVNAVVGTAAVVPSAVVYGREVAAHEVVRPFTVLGDQTP